MKSNEIDFGLYTARKLSDTFRLYWRILKERKELEVVMVVNGTSYAALGWRPRSLTKSCKNFPLIGDPPSTTKVGVKEEGTAEPTSEPEPSSEPAPEPKQEPTAEPNSEPEPSTEPESILSTPEPVTTTRKSLYSRRSAYPTPVVQTAHPQADVVETSVSYQVSKKQGMSFSWGT